MQDHITSVHEVPEEKIRHIEIVSDEGIKSYKCLICSVDFPEEKIVKKHISDEHGPALFRCDFESCEYTNPRISQMKIHIDTGKSLSEALILASVNPQYDERFFFEFQEKYK